MNRPLLMLTLFALFLQCGECLEGNVSRFAMMCIDGKSMAFDDGTACCLNAEVDLEASKSGNFEVVSAADRSLYNSAMYAQRSLRSSFADADKAVFNASAELAKRVTTPCIDGIDHVHQQSGHHTYDPQCPVCVESSLRGTQHRSNRSVSVGKLWVDLQELNKGDGYVLVGFYRVSKDQRMSHAVPVSGKGQEAIENGLRDLILSMEYILQLPLVARVHGDLECSLVKARENLAHRWIKLTTTQGRDPAANGPAEWIGGELCRRSRKVLAHLEDGITKRRLWSNAMVWSSWDYSKQNVSGDVGRVRRSDILPFGESTVSCWVIVDTNRINGRCAQYLRTLNDVEQQPRGGRRGGRLSPKTMARRSAAALRDYSSRIMGFPSSSHSGFDGYNVPSSSTYDQGNLRTSACRFHICTGFHDEIEGFRFQNHSRRPGRHA